MTVTKREVILSCGVIALLLLIGLSISMAISNAQQVDISRYETSVKVNDNNELIQYALETKQTNICAYGMFDGGDGVTDDMIDGVYYAIERVYQHYTMHTRTVTTTVNGKTSTRTEVYYTWDTQKRENQVSPNPSFMGTDLPVKVSNYSQFDTIKTDHNDRIIFNVIPLQQYGLIHPHNIDADEIPLSFQTMESYEDSLHSNAGQIFFWIFFVAVIGGAVYYIFYSDWRWLNK